MELTRQQITQGLFGEFESIARLIEGLTPDQWDAPTRCTGWRVRDVAGHVAGGAIDAVTGTSGARTADDQARDLRGDDPQELARKLRRASFGLARLIAGLSDDGWTMPVPNFEFTLDHGIHILWFDAYVHADDVRAALGQPSQRDPGLGASVAFLARRLRENGWGPAELALGDLPVYRVVPDGATGSVPVVEGDPLRFVLVATGRADPAELGLDELGLAKGVDIFSVR